MLSYKSKWIQTQVTLDYATSIRLQKNKFSNGWKNEDQKLKLKEKLICKQNEQLHTLFEEKKLDPCPFY